ncbi:MAG: translation initiation factor IF-2 [Candidatus Heimdallarchaeota archaeon]
MSIRSPIATILGHVDTGKTLLLDRIRGTAVQAREAGGITQHVGASFFPRETLEEICGDLLKTFNFTLSIPGLLIIDTPGHESFFNLRRRGASVADIAILVVDVLSGFQPQTYESLALLKARKTPFLVAANKIDRIPGWNPAKTHTSSFLTIKDSQDSFVTQDLDKRIYEIMGELSREGISSERFDRVNDYTKNVGIVPTSAKTGEGIPDLLLVLSALTQQYMMEKLEVSKGAGQGVVLEVKEEVGIGKTIDVILFDGVLKKNDTIVVGGLDQPVVSKIRALLQPKALDEIRDPKERFLPVTEVAAAAGVRIVAQGLEGTAAGSPLYVSNTMDEIEHYKEEILQELEQIKIETDDLGIIVKADTLGSLEALLNLLRQKNIPIRFANVGDVARRDVIQAEITGVEDPLLGVVLAFNVGFLPDARELIDSAQIPFFENNIIYRLLEEYDGWQTEQRAKRREEAFEELVKPAKITLLPDYIFRKSDPAVVGIEVMTGTLRPRVNLVRTDNKRVGLILQIQSEGKTVAEAKEGDQVAISIRGPTVGRQIREGDQLLTNIPESHAKRLQEHFSDLLTPSELETLEELINLKRTYQSKFWAR